MLGSNKKVHSCDRKYVLLNQFHMARGLGNLIEYKYRQQNYSFAGSCNTTTKNLLFKTFRDLCFNSLIIKKIITTLQRFIGSGSRFRTPGFQFHSYNTFILNHSLFDHGASAWDTHIIVLQRIVIWSLRKWLVRPKIEMTIPHGAPNI